LNSLDASLLTNPETLDSSDASLLANPKTLNSSDEQRKINYLKELLPSEEFKVSIIENKV
jgi:hypothetical protein